MEIQKNSRQIPSVKFYTSNKNYNDIMYGLLQEKSYYENGSRYIDKEMVDYTKLGDELNISRQTCSKRFRKLEQLNLLEYDLESERYKIINLDSELAALIPESTLKKLVHALSTHSISLYVFFLKLWYRNQFGEYKVSIKAMKEYIGIASTTTSNNDIITDIMDVLQKLDLIKFELRWEAENRCSYWITYVGITI